MGNPSRSKQFESRRDYFALFGVRPAMGRTFSAEEDRPGGPRAAVIGNGLWKRRFAADPHLVGRPVVLREKRTRWLAFFLPVSSLILPPISGLPLAADPRSLNQATSCCAAGASSRCDTPGGQPRA